MRRLAVAVFVATVVGLTFAGATFAGGDHGRGHRGLTFFSTENALTPVPVVAGKFSQGDRVVFSDDLFTAKGGTQVGTDGGVSAPSCASPTRRRAPASFSAWSPSRCRAGSSRPRR